MKKLSQAQKIALAKITLHGGHGVGPFSGIRTRTAEILAERGLIVLGTIPHARLTDRRTTWAIGPDVDHVPHGFVSDEEMTRQWDDFARRAAERRAKLRPRQDKVIEAARAKRIREGKPHDTEWETKVRQILSFERKLREAEKFLGLD